MEATYIQVGLQNSSEAGQPGELAETISSIEKNIYALVKTVQSQSTLLLDEFAYYMAEYNSITSQSAVDGLLPNPEAVNNFDTLTNLLNSVAHTLEVQKQLRELPELTCEDELQETYVELQELASEILTKIKETTTERDTMRKELLKHGHGRGESQKRSGSPSVAHTSRKKSKSAPRKAVP